MKPILFSTPMVQAILDENKTQTRRLIKPQPIDNTLVDGNFFEGNCKGYVKVDGHPNWRDQFVHEFAKYQIDDILWVKETYYAFGEWKRNGKTKTGKQKCKFDRVKSSPFRYFNNKPDSVESPKFKGLGWYKRPSLFMPKEAARIFLKITDIRVERLQDISNEDAIAEGIECVGVKPTFGYGGSLLYKNYINNKVCLTASDSFKTLWQSINGAESWEENPWVWVISYERIEKH